MIYATTADLESYLGTEAYERLCDRDDSGAVDTADVEDALSRASSMADSYIAKWIPALQAAAGAPALLVQHVLFIAVYLLAGDDYTKDQRKRYDDAIAWLQAVQAGDVTLDVPPVGNGETAASIARVFAEPRVMTRCSLRGVLL